MAKLPSLELLEATHQFPGPYIFKIIGSAENHLEARAVAAIREELFLDKDPAYTRRLTGDGKHIAITIEIEVTTAAEIHQIYHRLIALPGVVVLL